VSQLASLIKLFNEFKEQLTFEQTQRRGFYKNEMLETISEELDESKEISKKLS
jgi:hypothetical protein